MKGIGRSTEAELQNLSSLLGYVKALINFITVNLTTTFKKSTFLV